MKKIILIGLILKVGIAFSQLNCKTTTNDKNELIKTCYHANKVISTIETWDKKNKFGNIKGFNPQNQEIFSFSLRRFGGHAAVKISYFDNGQVSRVDYSDAPDGGIQFYNASFQFDEQGKQIDFSETKYPFELQTSIPPLTDKKETQKINECAIPMLDYFQLVNSTKSKIFLQIKTKPNFNYAVKEFYVTLKPKEKIIFDSITSAQFHPKMAIYEPMIISYSKKKKNNILQLVATTREDKVKNSKTWIWVVSDKSTNLNSILNSDSNFSK